jgi:hypothetical protein
MIDVIKKTLIVYGLVDFALQVIAQMPLFDAPSSGLALGFRKIWVNPVRPAGRAFQYQHYIDNLDSDDEPRTLRLDWFSLTLQFLNCVLICTIMLQGEIFDSYGYNKFVTQQGGSMDLLV